MASIQDSYEILAGEQLKTAAEFTIHTLAKSELGRRAIELYAYGPSGRIEDPALHTEIAGIPLENPFLTGAGWDKRGWAVNGLYSLGFAGTEVGTVPLFGQPGLDRPRLFTLDKRHSVGLNAMGFNSKGAVSVAHHLDDQQPIMGILGVSVGLNALMPHEHAPWAHSAVVSLLYKYADYFVFNPASPNTKELHKLQRKDMLRACIQSMQEAMEELGGQKPLFVKLSPDIKTNIFEDAVQTTVDQRASGLVLANTSTARIYKAMYGAEDRPGGISGDINTYRSHVLGMIIDAYEEVGDQIDIIASGGVSTADHAVEYMIGGASAVQVMTAMRPTHGRIAAQLNRGTLDYLKGHNVSNVKELIGVGTQRGAKFPTAA